MSAFVSIVPNGTSIQPVLTSSRVPGGRLCGEFARWIGVPQSTAISAFAFGSVTFVGSGADHGIPGDDTAAWTLFELSPLPQMAAAAFKGLAGGLPVQLVIVMGSGAAGPIQDDCLAAGSTFVTAPAGSGSTAYFAMVFQDRICRDPLTWASDIAATGACDAGWAQFVTDLASKPDARKLYILDHIGRPLTSGSVSVAVDGGAATNVTFPPNSDGDTGKMVPDGSRATVTFLSATNPVVASVGTDDGNPIIFDSSSGQVVFPPFQLPLGKRLAQVLDANFWFAQCSAGVTGVKRWNPNSMVEPIVDGNPYFARLVEDLRKAKPGAAAGAAELAGWAFVKGSLADSSVDWPLIPGQDDTTLLHLVDELVGAGVNVKFLVNQFLQFDSPTLDDFPELVGILAGIYAALMIFQAYGKIATDPAGFGVGFLAISAAGVLLGTGLSEDLLRKIAEYSKDMVESLNAAHPGIATWTPYPAAFSDNPLVPQPFTLAGHTIDDFSHLGVYHQKYINIKTADGRYVSFLGGIDINSDRVDTPLHRAIHPFHDVQVRVTGPATQDLIQSFAGRLNYHEHTATPPIPTPASVPDAGTHLVQIARTYYRPTAGSGSTPFSFAPSGESTPIDTIKTAIGQARDFIYIEDQYFTPPDDYLQTLLDAADPARGVRALFITCPYQTDQPYGGERRSDVLNALQTAWATPLPFQTGLATRLFVGTPFRRFLHPTPALTTNLGRMRLASSMTAGDAQATFAPEARLPKPPFWAFIGSELVLAHSVVGPKGSIDGEVTQTVEIIRAGGGPSWGAYPTPHPKGEPVTCVQVPGIYVHAKMMIVDDIFMFVGSSNINRRGLYHDGEMDSFTIPQHLKGDPINPARILRSRLMAEHLGLPPEMGISLFADPLSAALYFQQRSWYIGSRRQPLSFFGSLPPDVPIGTSDSIGGQLLAITIGVLRDAIKGEAWRSLVDPTTTLQPAPRLDGPNYP